MQSLFTLFIDKIGRVVLRQGIVRRLLVVILVVAQGTTIYFLKDVLKLSGRHHLVVVGNTSILYAGVLEK